MMRNFFTVALGAALMMTAGTASALSVNLIFRDSGTSTLDLTGGLQPTAVVDVFMDTEDTSNLQGFSFSVQYDTGGGLVATAATEYTSIFQSTAAQVSPPANAVGVNLGLGLAESWDGLTLNALGIGPCPGPTGTVFIGTCDPTFGYLMGTITLDTSSLTGNSTLTPGVSQPQNGFSAGGLDIDPSTINFNSATIQIVPEPATASLLMLGLAGLVVASRKRV